MPSKHTVTGSNPVGETKFYREAFMQTKEELDRSERAWESRWEQEYEEYLESLDEEDEEDYNDEDDEE